MIKMGSLRLNSFDIVPWRKETIKATDFLWEKAIYNNLSTLQKILTSRLLTTGYANADVILGFSLLGVSLFFLQCFLCFRNKIYSSGAAADSSPLNPRCIQVLPFRIEQLRGIKGRKTNSRNCGQLTSRVDSMCIIPGWGPRKDREGQQCLMQQKG